MGLEERKGHRDAMTRHDPLWAILTSQNKKGRKWDSEAFFATGRRDIAAVMAYINSLASPPRRKALDFGCGLGRLTQALCGYYDECVGVDSAPGKIRQARKLNQFGDKCRYLVNATPDLRLFADGTFDLVYSASVLPHIHPASSRNYVQEFLRILAPGGIVLFQMPGHPRLPGEPGHSRRHRAHIELLSAPGFGRVGSMLEVQARVTNLGDSPWLPDEASAEQPVRLGCHWLDTAGNLLVLDDGRAGLPREVQPGGAIDLALQVRAPKDAGTYVLELDMAQESVTWFKDRGSATVGCEVQITSPYGQLHHVARRVEHRLRTSIDGRRFVPGQEPQAVPQKEVLALLEANGGVALDVREDNWAQPGWVSYTYCAAKSPVQGIKRRFRPTSVIVPVWNGETIIRQCLAALYDSPADVPSEVICVENASHDGSRAALHEFPTVRVLPQHVNLGFAGGICAGVAAASGDLLFLLNQDALLRPGWSAALAEALEAHPEAGIAGCTVYHADGSLDHAGACIARPQAEGVHLTDRGDGTPRKVEYVTGAAMAIRRSCWDAVGGFDQGFYPAYFEEADFCLRAAERGFSTLYVPQAEVDHVRSSRESEADPVKHWANEQRSRYRFVSKHFRGALLDEFFAYEIAAIMSESWLANAIGRVLGARDTLRGLPDILARRSAELGGPVADDVRLRLVVGFTEVMRAAFAAAQRLTKEWQLPSISSAADSDERWEAVERRLSLLEILVSYDYR